MSTLDIQLEAKTSQIEALNAENEQLRRLLQRSADAHTSTESDLALATEDDDKSGVINDLQVAIAHMRSQLIEATADCEAHKTHVQVLLNQNLTSEEKLKTAKDRIAALQTAIDDLQSKLSVKQGELDEAQTRIASLKTGLDDSKKAIVILQEQLERRTSESAAARRASLEVQGIPVPPLLRDGNLGSRQNSLAFPNVSEARRGSLNYLNGLGLATKRTAYFDSARAGEKRMHGSLAGPASCSLDADANSSSSSTGSLLARRRASLPATSFPTLMHGYDQDIPPVPTTRNGLPPSASSPHLGPNASRRSSLATPGRRGSVGYENTSTTARRNSHLAHTLSRLAANTIDSDLPLSRRGSRVISGGDNVPLSSLPEYDNASAFGGGQGRRRSSLLATGGSTHARRPSEKTIPLLMRDSADDSISRAARKDSGSLKGEGDAIIQALSAEAAMEIANLREAVAHLKLQLYESEEAREASETCARVLREFIANQADEEANMSLRLPPLPTEADGLESATPNAKVKTDAPAASGTPTKRNTIWGIPKMLPTLTYGAIRRGASDTPQYTPSLATTARPKRDSISEMGGSDLLLPPRVAEIARRASATSSHSEYSCGSGPVSPFLGFAARPTFTSDFDSFSFSARRDLPNTPTIEPPSPGAGRSNAPQFADMVTSSEDSEESDAGPITPTEGVYGRDEKQLPELSDKAKDVQLQEALGAGMTSGTPRLT